MKIQFLGACQQVTGSCFYLEIDNLRLLVDCGIFQERAYLNRNWDPFPISPSSLDYILLTHVHLDHAGLIPRLVHGGFKGKILMTTPSGALLPVVLLDSAKIQEEDARYKRKRHKKEGRKGPFPVVPLYTVEDAEKSLRLFEEIPYEQSTPLDQNVSVIFHDAGHILGSAMVELQIRLKIPLCSILRIILLWNPLTGPETMKIRKMWKLSLKNIFFLRSSPEGISLSQLLKSSGLRSSSII